MHVARNAVLCVPSVLVRNGSTFFGLPEGQNMVSLYGGTTVKPKKIITPIVSIKVLGITQPSVKNCMENCLNILLDMQEHKDIISCVLYLHMINNNIYMSMKKALLEIDQHLRMQQQNHYNHWVLP